MIDELLVRLGRTWIVRGAERDREIAHDRALRMLAWAQEHGWPLWGLRRLLHPGDSDGCLRQEFLDMSFAHPIGLAAGWDKNARVPRALAACGFSFIELGTVTQHPQPGFDRPRIWGLPNGTLINRMGFPNEGVDAFERRLVQESLPTIPVGISIGKSKVTPNERAVDEYVYLLRRLHPYGRYFTVNVSSPNTPGLRDLMAREPLEHMLSALQDEARRLGRAHGRKKSLFVKVSPDMSDAEVDDVVDVCLACELEGIIGTNTTIKRPGLSQDRTPPGGLSGPRLLPLAHNVVQRIAQRARGKLVIIACGGISNWWQALDMLQAGASLVQVFTSWTYDPLVVKKIVDRLRICLWQKDARNLDELLQRSS